MIASRCRRANTRNLIRSVTSSRHIPRSLNVSRYSTERQNQQESAQDQGDGKVHDTTAPPEVVGEPLRSPTFGRLAPDATEEEKNKFIEEEELRRKRRQLGFRLQAIGALGMVVGGSMLIYLKKKEEEEQEEEKRRRGGGGGGSGSDHDEHTLPRSKVGLDSVYKMEQQVAQSIAREQQEVTQFKRDIESKYNEFRDRYFDESRKRSKYEPTESELQMQMQHEVVFAEEGEQTENVANATLGEHPVEQNESKNSQTNVTALTQTKSENEAGDVPVVQSTAEIDALQSQISQLQEEIARLKESAHQQKSTHDITLRAEREKISNLETELSEARKLHEIAVKKHEQELHDKLKEQEHNFSLQYQKENMKRIETIDELAARVNALNYVYYENAQYFDESYELQKLTVGVLALQQALKTSGPLKPEIEALSKVNQVGGDELIGTLLDSIPQEAVEYGVPKLMELERSFRYTRRQALGASYTPEGMGFFGKLYSKLASLFIVNENGLIDGTDVGATLARAQFYLEHGRLDQAIWELRGIESKAEVMEQLQEWLSDANRRLQLNQIDTILTNHLINLTQSRDTFLFPPLETPSSAANQSSDKGE